MGLRDLVIPTELVKISDSDGFAVRGLTPSDVLGLYQRHAGDLSSLYDKFVGKANSGEGFNSGEVLASLLSGAPHILGEIIALATDSDPRGTDWAADCMIAVRLPAGAQVDALEKIGRLTFTSDMPAPKFFGLVIQMAQSATAVIANVPPQI